MISQIHIKACREFYDRQKKERTNKGQDKRRTGGQTRTGQMKDRTNVGHNNERQDKRRTGQTKDRKNEGQEKRNTGQTKDWTNKRQDK